MISYFSNELTATRQISDLRFGIPIILGNNDTYEMIVAIETLNEETFQKILEYSNSSNLEPYIDEYNKQAKSSRITLSGGRAKIEKL